MQQLVVAREGEPQPRARDLPDIECQPVRVVAHPQRVLVFVVLGQQGQPCRRERSRFRIDREGVRLDLQRSVLERVGELSGGEGKGGECGLRRLPAGQRIAERDVAQGRIESCGGEGVFFAFLPHPRPDRGAGYGEAFDGEPHFPQGGVRCAAGVACGTGYPFEGDVGSVDPDGADAQDSRLVAFPLAEMDARGAHPCRAGFEQGNGAVLSGPGSLLILQAHAAQGDAAACEVYPYALDIGGVGASVEVDRLALQQPCHFMAQPGLYAEPGAQQNGQDDARAQQQPSFAGEAFDTYVLHGDDVVFRISELCNYSAFCRAAGGESRPAGSAKMGTSVPRSGNTVVITGFLCVPLEREIMR